MPSPEGLNTFIQQDEETELLRFSTAGSVDDGKSTLIGRLLYDSKGVYEDQLASVQKATSKNAAGTLEFALLTDGLRAEREQGITIDVAYRYFSTPRRKFIIADTPGHEQYTRNMATGASNANLAIILVDARSGVLDQSRRHAFIASLLGIPHIVVAVNKMDLVDFREEVFNQICRDFSDFAAPFQVTDLHFIPISALHGDNVVEKSSRMPWFAGEPLLRYLETVHIASDRNFTEMRFPVQYVIRSQEDFRGYAGQVASGVLKTGDSVMVMPSGKLSRVKSIVTYDGALQKAFPPMSITVCLEDEIDIGRGDMLVPPSHAPQASTLLDVRMVWMGSEPLVMGRQYLIKHTTQSVRARAIDIRYRLNINTLEKQAATELKLNDVGAAVFETFRPLFFDSYKRNRATGSLIVIDPVTNATVGAGMITGRRPQQASVSSALLGQLRFRSTSVTEQERATRLGHESATVWLNGTPELADRIERMLFDRGCLAQVLAEDRESSTLAELASVTAAAGVITICCFLAGDAQERIRARNLATGSSFIEIDSSSLPDSVDEAARHVCQLLEQNGVIRSVQ